MTGFVGETTQGGPVENGGSTVTTTGNRAPEVTAPPSRSIPVRTPFRLAGSATDADSDPVTYMWEQNDRGGSSGTTLVSNTKPDGPLFRTFGTAAIVGPADALLSPSPGENAATTDPERVFPDMAQIVAGNTNASSGTCPAATDPVPPATVDCYSEFLPTTDYVGFAADRTMHFRLTARDRHVGAGGVGFADTSLTVVPAAGPFRVTSQAAPATATANSPLVVSWDVAGTNAAPINATNVELTMSANGGESYPLVLAASTPNDGSQSVAVPNVATAHARIMVRAVGNVFFDISHADLTIDPSSTPSAANNVPDSGATVQYTDAPATAITITSFDDDSPGSSLSAEAVGLPVGMSLSAGSPSGGPPGARTFTVGGATTAAPGTYPVVVTVTDGSHSNQTSFSIVVAPEDAGTSYAGDTTATIPAGGSSAAVTLRAALVDSSGLASSGDQTGGDLSTATVTFKEGGTTLCAAAAATPAPGNPARAQASCVANLPVGAHAIDLLTGGRYTGSGVGTVTVNASSPGPGPRRATNGNDSLTGDGRANVICGLFGNDTINGLGGNDTLWGDRCNDRTKSLLAAAARRDGNDTLIGGNGNDRLFGAGGNDSLKGGKGNDQLFGGGGNDKLAGGPGVNKYSGGAGTDSVNARNGKRERVDCGRGRKDVATVDKRDRTKGCEKVRRARR
jgi:Ca2+-binding RTX toxin-like protein